MSSNIASIKNFISTPCHGLLSGVEFIGDNLTDLPIHVGREITSGICKVTESVGYLLKGGVFAFTSVASLGTRKEAVFKARASLHIAGTIVANIYKKTLNLLNPDSQINIANKAYQSDVSYYLSPASIFLQKTAKAKSNKLLNKKDESTFKKESLSRLYYLAAIIAVVVITVFYALLGTLAAPFSLLTLGRSTELNRIAYSGLLAPQIVSNLFTCLMGIINPHSLNYTPPESQNQR